MILSGVRPDQLLASGRYETYFFSEGMLFWVEQQLNDYSLDLVDTMSETCFINFPLAGERKAFASFEIPRLLNASRQ